MFCKYLSGAISNESTMSARRHPQHDSAQQDFGGSLRREPGADQQQGRVQYACRGALRHFLDSRGSLSYGFQFIARAISFLTSITSSRIFHTLVLVFQMVSQISYGFKSLPEQYLFSHQSHLQMVSQISWFFFIWFLRSLTKVRTLLHQYNIVVFLRCSSTARQSTSLSRSCSSPPTRSSFERESFFQ